MSADQSAAGDGWGTYVPPEGFDPPELPLGLLPPVLGDYARVVAESVQCDPALPALMGMGVVAALTQKTAQVRATPRWSEQLSLFVLALADVSERKSPSYKHMVGPVHKLEDELAQVGQEARIYANEKRRVLAKQLENARRDAGNTNAKRPTTLDAVAEMAAELEAMGPEERPPRIATDDATPERLKGLMSENHGRIALLSPEASFLHVLAGAYTNNGRPADFSALLSAYSGSEPLTVDRQGREHVRVPRPALSVVMVGQPTVLEELSRVKGAQERGLVARFVVCRVPSRAGSRPLQTGDEPGAADTTEGKEYRELLGQLADRTSSDTPPVLALDPDALEEYRAWHDALERERGPHGGRWSGIADFAGKAHGLALRFAGLSHLCEHPAAGDGDLIGPDAMIWAQTLTDWALESHRLAVVGARVPAEVRQAHRVLGAAARGTLSQSRKDHRGPWAAFTVRDLQRFLGYAGKSLTSSDVLPLVEFLQAQGWVRPVPGSGGLLEWHPGLAGGMAP
ncbi:MAG: YfjI family protein [Candidatus Nanopelagicales bacterium]